MPHVFTQLYIHLVFAVKGKENLLPKEQLPQLERYMTSIIQGFEHKLVHIKCMPDHSHLVIGWKPHQSLAELVSKTKTDATVFLKRNADIAFNIEHFSWQKGYGAFSYSLEHIDSLVKYLMKQESYHQTHTFREEYLNILDKFDIPYDDQYLFEFYDITP